MRRSTLTKSIGLFSAFVYAFAALATNVQPNLYTDKLHLTGESTQTVLTLDINKQVKSSAVTSSTLLDLNNSTDANTPSTLVKRDASGNFSAGTVTANLIGNVTGTATSAQQKWNYTAQTSNYTAAVGDWINASGANFNITLPDATVAGVSGRPIVVHHLGTWPQQYTILTTGGQTITGPPANTAYTSGQVILYTPDEQMEFWPNSTGWYLRNHRSDTSWIDLGTFMKYVTFTNTAAAATLAAVYSPAETFTLVSAGNSTAAATYVPGYIFTVTAAAVTAAATYVPAYSFTVSAANATVAAVYKDSNGASYTVAATIAAGTNLVLTGTSTPPAGPGVLTFFSGTGDATINYSSFTGNASNFATFTDQVTIAAGTTMTTTSPVASIGSLAANGKLVKLAGTGDAVVNYSAATGFASGTTTCTTAATIAAATSLVMTCTQPPPSAGTLVKTAGTGDIPLPYNAVTGEDTAGGTKAYRVANTIAAGTTLTTQNEVAFPSLSSGKLGKISGTGDTVITYSAVSGAVNTMGATTTVPTFYGLPTINGWKFRRVNGEFAELWIQFYQTVAGIVGSGDYIYATPPNFTINTTTYPVFTTGTAQTGQGTTALSMNSIFSKGVYGDISTQGSQAMQVVGVAPYTSTSFRVYVHNLFGTSYVQTGSSFGSAATVMSYNFAVLLPMNGWIP